MGRVWWRAPVRSAWWCRVYKYGVVAGGQRVFWVPFSRPFRTILIWPPSPTLLYWLVLRCPPQLSMASPTTVGAPGTFTQRTRNGIAGVQVVVLGAYRHIGRHPSTSSLGLVKVGVPLPPTSCAPGTPHFISVVGCPPLGRPCARARRFVVPSCGRWHWVRFAHSTSRGGQPPPRKLAPPPSYSFLWVVRVCVVVPMAPFLLSFPLQAGRWAPHTPPTPPHLRGDSPRFARFTGSPTARGIVVHGTLPFRLWLHWLVPFLVFHI